MGIALIIVGGLVLMTVAASAFGYLGERKKRLDPKLGEAIERMEKRLSAIEERLNQDEDRFEHLEGDVSFVHKLISDKSK